MPAAPSFGPVRGRKARVGPMVLPASGRSGRAPKWPLEGVAPKVWGELWKTPQSVAWEALGWTRVVARYTLRLLEAEAPNAKMDVNAEARQLEDRLGLTPKAMRLLLWTIEADEPAGELTVVDDARWRNAAVS